MAFGVIGDSDDSFTRAQNDFNNTQPREPRGSF
jgi:hypothetical protein